MIGLAAFLLYIIVGFFVAFYQALDLSTSGDYALRSSVFWPLYTIRWLVTSFILAIRGL